MSDSTLSSSEQLSSQDQFSATASDARADSRANTRSEIGSEAPMLAVKYQIAKGGQLMFLNLAHFLDHFFMLIFSTVAAFRLSQEWGMSYAELVPYATPGFITFGVCSLAAGWLADKWGREKMMLIFFLGIGFSGIAAGFTTSPLQIALALTLVGIFAFLPWIGRPNQLFGVSTVVLIVISSLMFLLLPPPSGEVASSRPEVPSWTSIGRSIVICIQSPRFWVGTLYFVGLFSSFLALEDLWNIRFQVDVFGKTSRLAASMNSMLVSGLTLGGVMSGLWAARSGLAAPSRAFSALALLIMIVLFSVPLSTSLAFLAMLVLGLGLGAAPLGLSFVRQELPKQAAAVASPLLLTFVFVGGGLLMSLVGDDLSGVSRLTFQTYQQSMRFFILPVAVATALSLLIRPSSPSLRSGT